jgi:hypothetical protein
MMPSRRARSCRARTWRAFVPHPYVHTSVLGAINLSQIAGHRSAACSYRSWPGRAPGPNAEDLGGSAAAAAPPFERSNVP